MDLQKIFDSFLQAGRFLKNWSPKTERSYRQAFTSFQQSLRQDTARAAGGPACGLTKTELEAWVVWMRQKGMSPGGCNVYIRGMNSFCTWLREEEHLAAPLRLRLLKVPTKPLVGFSDAELKALMSHKPAGFLALRVWVLTQTLLDTGIRIEEALTLKTAAVNLDAMTLTVTGKGDKTRTVPFSVELRKILFRYLQAKGKAGINPTFIFCCQNGHRLAYRNAYRDISRLCGAVGITGKHVHPHSLRHAFACSYIRQGGDIYRLSRILGHCSVSTTQLYLRSMGVEHLAEDHRSPLARL